MFSNRTKQTRKRICWIITEQRLYRQDQEKCVPSKFRSGNSKPRDYSCPGLDCNVRFVAGRNFERMKKSDALIFDHVANWDWDLMIKKRPAGQKWIFFSRESPMHTIRHAMPPDKYRNITYDYTMTYARESGHSKSVWVLRRAQTASAQ